MSDSYMLLDDFFIRQCASSPL